MSWYSLVGNRNYLVLGTQTYDIWNKEGLNLGLPHNRNEKRFFSIIHHCVFVFVFLKDKRLC